MHSLTSVRLDIADIVIQHNQDKAKCSLENAKTDGHICFKSKNTRRVMTLLAETYQKLAKFPSIRDYGPEFVKAEHYLHQALDYLFYATHSGDPIDYHWTNRISSCLFDLGEYEKAIEWQRKTWLLSAPSNSGSFYILCIYMLTRYAKDDSLKTRMEPFLREFLYILTYGKNKYKDITRNIESIYKKRPYEIYKLLTAVIVEKVITVREDEKYILQHCLNILIRIASRNKRRNVPTFNREFQDLNSTLYHIVPSEENEYVLSDIFENSSIFPFPKSLRCLSKDFKFDFFVCHSHKDSDWVHNMLLRHLESTFDEQDISFKGCIADRNFTPGVSVRDNIVEAIQSSCKVILVLTDHFVSSQWCQCEANQAIMRSLGLNDVQDQDCNSNCVIPVLLEECKIPIKLQHLTYSDMTIEQDFVFEMRRLKRALLPEVL